MKKEECNCIGCKIKDQFYEAYCAVMEEITEKNLNDVTLSLRVTLKSNKKDGKKNGIPSGTGRKSSSN